jgi:outer membrane protein assembly factor BamB
LLGDARRKRFLWVVVILEILMVLSFGSAGATSSPTVGQADRTAPWSSFGFGLAHTSKNAAADSVTTKNADSLVQAWRFATPPPTVAGQPKVGFDGSPVVAHGMVFAGSSTGVFYALNEDTGAVVWSLNAGFLPKYTCPAAGILDTATVASNPTNGKPTVYFAGANGKLWAVDAETGSVDWQVNVFAQAATSAKFVWGSPTIYSGRVYIGIASGCDKPLTRGGLASFNQASGARMGTFWTVPATSVGGSIWSTPAAAAAGVFVTTGNGDETKPSTQGLSNSIVELNPTTLAPVAHWTIPNIATVDDDFGSSPTLFKATLNGVVTPMVGACDKNGVYYALSQTGLANGPVWSIQLGTSAMPPSNACLATASWNGTDLVITTNSSTVSGVNYPAVARELNPANGAILWQTGLADGPVLGNSALDGAGVLAAISYSTTSPTSTNQLSLVNVATGAVLANYPTGTPSGGGPVWADGYLMFDGSDGLLHAYRASVPG